MLSFGLWLASLPVVGTLIADMVIKLAAVEPSPIDWLDLVSRAGVVGLFVLFTWAVLTKRLVPGWSYVSMETDRNYYRDLAEKGTAMAERQLDLAERIVERTERERR